MCVSYNVIISHRYVQWKSRMMCGWPGTHLAARHLHKCSWWWWWWCICINVHDDDDHHHHHHRHHHHHHLHHLHHRLHHRLHRSVGNKKKWLSWIHIKQLTYFDGTITSDTQPRENMTWSPKLELLIRTHATPYIAKGIKKVYRVN